MTVLPVVARELRVAARRPWTYWSRMGAALVGLIVIGWLLLLYGLRSGHQTGGPVFSLVSSVALGFSLLAGLMFTADSVSSEKRDGTLGLLFLTDLRGWDIALGKLAATSLGALYGLLAVLPLLGLAWLLGGVTAADYGRMVLVLVSTLFCSLNLGLLGSVLTTDVRRSVALVFALLVAMTCAGPLLNELGAWALTRWGAPGETIDGWARHWTTAATPFLAFYWVPSINYAGKAREFVQSIVFLWALGLLALAYSSWRLPRVWQEKGLKARRSGWRGWLERLRFGDASRKDVFRRGILNVNAVTWLSARHWLREWLVWLFLATFLSGIGLLASDTLGGGWWEVELGVVVSIALHIVLKFWLANEAPRQFLEDRQSGAIELLLSTSLTVDDILRGRWLALRRQFLGPVVAVLMLDWYFLSSLDFSRMDGGFSDLVQIGLAHVVMLLVDLWAIGWDGLWAGLTLRGRNTSFTIITRILILPWLIWLTGLAFRLLEVLDRVAGQLNLSSFTIQLGAWLAIGIVNSLFWGFLARHRLKTSFREIATQRARKRRWPWQRAASIA